MPDPATHHSVGELAGLAGISVRTLHHYDEIGLLRPSARGAGGRRAYSPADAARLGQLLTYRALGLPLDRIAALLDGARDEPEVLREQLALVTDRIAQLTTTRDHILLLLEASDMNIELTPEERLELFGDRDPAQWEAEAEERWGETDAWRESRQRTRRYSADDWRRIKAELDEIEEAFAAAMAAGEPATGEAAARLAERARLHIAANFYDLTHEMHRRLAELYVTDSRFAAHYDGRAPGLARYVHDAINANADAQRPRSAPA